MSLESDLRAAALAFTGPATVQAELNRIVDTPDIRAAYASDFLKQCAALPADDFHWVKQTLRTKLTKDFDLTEWKRRIREARVALDTSSPLNGWHAHLMNTDRGPRPVLANAIAALRMAPEWQGVLGYDLFADRPVARAATPWGTIPEHWTDTEDSRLVDWLQHQGILVRRDSAREAVDVVSRDESFHPVREHLESLDAWDGEDRLSTWLYRCLGVEVPSDPKLDAYVCSIARMWPISAIARIFDPGCMVHTCLILEGEQGRQKSKSLETLAIRRKWFTDCLSPLGTQNARMEVHGVWIVEMGDLHAYRAAERNTVRNFISCPEDRFRLPYGARLVWLKRQSVFAGTSNDDTWGNDPQGERRMWPVYCNRRADVAMLGSILPQFWAEALARYRAGEPWWFAPGGEVEETAREEQRARCVEHPWRARVEKYLRDNPGGYVTTEDLLNQAVHVPPDRQTRGQMIQLGNILKSLGCEKEKHREGKDVNARYRKPE